MYNQKTKSVLSKMFWLKFWYGLGAFIILFLFFKTVGFERIDAGHAGIRVNLYGTKKGVSDVALVTGGVWYNKWMEEIHEMPINIRTKDFDAFKVGSSEGSLFDVDPKISYHVIQTEAPRIFRMHRVTLDAIENGFMSTIVRDAFRIVINKYTAEQIVSKREQVEADIQTTLSTAMLKQGFQLDQLTSGLIYPGSLTEVINAKTQSIQARLKAENEALQAESEGKVRIAKAKADAEVVLTKARAEAESYRIRQQQLTPLLIQQQWIEKWDGKLPTTQLGNNTTPLVNIK